MAALSTDPSFAESELEAAQRAAQFREVDPFPEVQPSLLNSADLADYVAATGMVYPFHYEADLLKPASYKVQIGGDYIYWDERNQMQADSIEKGQAFILKANSIAFVTLEPTFRLPLYIAARFNLRVANIYRGLLLGTGPLVDPGFEGRLSIPLHNLTTNDYTFHGAEGLIWMEFTKVSSPPGLKSSEGPPRRGKIFELGQQKDYQPNRKLSDYLAKAAPHQTIRSSVPDVVEQAKVQARTAQFAASRSERSAKSIQRTITIGGIVALIAVLLALFAVVLQTHTLVDEVNGRIDSLSKDIAVQSQSASSSNLNSRLCALEAQLKRPKPTPCP